MTAIVFDLDGTVLHFDRPYGDILADAIAAVRGDVPDAWLETYNEAFFEAFFAFESDPVRRAFAQIDGCTDSEPYAEALLETEIDAMSPPEDAYADLERLAQTFDLGVLTNGVPDWQLAKLRAYDLEEYFDAIVVSYEVGAHKPTTEPYRAIEDRLPAQQYVMVGDSDDDVEGATEAGWDAYRYEGEGFGELPGALGVDGGRQ